MAFRDLFSTRRATPPADVLNEAGGTAYQLTPRQALAQFAVTGCFGGTYYATATDQLDQVLDLARQVAADGDDGPAFVAQVALHARSAARMKDMPALLVAFLTVDHGALAAAVFDRVIDDAGMLRKFVQVLRSGAVGRRSLGTRPRRLVRRWFDQRTDRQVFHGSIGSQPSLGDILKMTHPRPTTPERSALYAWLCGRDVDAAALPADVRAFEAYKHDPGGELPDVPFRMLTGLPLDAPAWRAIARRATWNQTRQHLNTFLRHGVFDDRELTRVVAERLADEALIRRSGAFPFQLMTAWQNIDSRMPADVRTALELALHTSLENVPEFAGRVAIAIDVSGSMYSPVPGHRRGATSKTTCLDVAALITAAVRARNPGAQVVAFHDRAAGIDWDPRWSVTDGARHLAALPSGGTDCSQAMRWIERHVRDVDVVLFVSDMESWLDGRRSWGAQRATETMVVWQRIRRRRPGAKLVCLDLQPYATSQAPTRSDILNVGGFSDRVFPVIDEFVRHGASPDHWVDTIRRTAV